MKQTAVEWLIENILSIPLEEATNVAHLKKYVNKVEIFDQAKAMEKEQIIDAYWGGLNGAINDYSDNKIKFGGGAEQYYNETFKSEIKW